MDIGYGLDVSDRKLKLLRRNKVNTVQQFLDRPSEDLQKILKRKATEIIETKKKLRGYNFRAESTSAAQDAQSVACSEYFDDSMFKSETLVTGISQFDELFPAGGIFSGDVIEICGRPATGKTVLLYTIVLNVLESNESCEIIYFDLNGFQAMKFKNMMDERGMADEVQQTLLKRLMIKKVSTVSSLNTHLTLMRRSKYRYDRVKIVVLESISALAYIAMGDWRIYKNKLRKTTELIRALSRKNISFLIANLALRKYVPPKPLASSSSQEESHETQPETSSPVEPSPEFNVRPALGHRWASTAHHKILVNFVDDPHRFEADCKQIHRTLSMLYSSTAKSTFPKSVEITDQGLF